MGSVKGSECYFYHNLNKYPYHEITQVAIRPFFVSSPKKYLSKITGQEALPVKNIVLCHVEVDSIIGEKSLQEKALDLSVLLKGLLNNRMQQDSDHGDTFYLYKNFLC